MIGALNDSEADRRLLPGGRFRGPTPFVIAIMTFAMMIVTAAGLALSNAAGLVATGIENRFAVQLPLGADLPRALAAARSSPGVAEAESVPEAEMRHTLERWLGPSGGAEDLPVPALITLKLSEGADPTIVGQRIAAAVPAARMVANEIALEPLLRSLAALKWLALSLVGMMAGATGAAVVLAARGALDTHRSTIEVMHGIGATDLQVTRLFQRKILLDALAGALAGGGTAALVMLLLGTGRFASELSAGPPLHGRDMLILAALPLVLAGLATWVARTAVLAALRRAT